MYGRPSRNSVPLFSPRHAAFADKFRHLQRTTLATTVVNRRRSLDPPCQLRGVLEMGKYLSRFESLFLRSEAAAMRTDGGKASALCDAFGAARSDGSAMSENGQYDFFECFDRAADRANTKRVFSWRAKWGTQQVRIENPRFHAGYRTSFDDALPPGPLSEVDLRSRQFSVVVGSLLRVQSDLEPPLRPTRTVQPFRAAGHLPGRNVCLVHD